MLELARAWRDRLRGELETLDELIALADGHEPKETWKPPGPKAYGRGVNRWTPDRFAMLDRDWPAGVELHELFAKISALPGPPISSPRTIAMKAAERGLQRPPGYVPPHMLIPPPRKAPIAWTPERVEILAREWPAGTPVREVCAMLNALPGEPLTPKQAGKKATDLHIYRPKPVSGSPSKHRRAVAPSKPPPPQVSTHQERGAPPEREMDPWVARPNTRPPSARQDPIPDADALIARHIAEKGVTKCPPVAVEATTATIPLEARREIQAHNAICEKKWAKQHPGKPVRKTGNPWTDQRKAIVARDYPAGVPIETILTRVNATPGPTMGPQAIQIMAATMNLPRGEAA